MTENKIALGCIGEKVIVSMVKSLFKDSFIRHNDFKNYNNGIGKGSDIKVDSIFDIEVKNWRTLRKTYGIDIAETEIINRFKSSNCQHRILLISFIECLSKKAVETIEKAHIHIFTFGQLLSSKLFRSSDYYTIRNELNDFFLYVSATPSFFGHVSVGYASVKLDNYVNTVKSVNTDKANTTITNITIKYDTPNHSKQLSDIERIRELDDKLIKVHKEPIYITWLRYKRDMES